MANPTITIQQLLSLANMHGAIFLESQGRSLVSTVRTCIQHRFVQGRVCQTCLEPPCERKPDKTSPALLRRNHTCRGFTIPSRSTCLNSSTRRHAQKKHQRSDASIILRVAILCRLPLCFMPTASEKKKKTLISCETQGDVSTEALPSTSPQLGLLYEGPPVQILAKGDWGKHADCHCARLLRRWQS